MERMHPLLEVNIAILAICTLLILADVAYQHRAQLLSSLSSLLNPWRKH